MKESIFTISVWHQDGQRVPGWSIVWEGNDQTDMWELLSNAKQHYPYVRLDWRDAGV